MSDSLLTFISVVEVLLLVIVLAIGLLIVAARLRSIASTLSEVTWGARAVERQLLAVPGNINGINSALTDIARTLPGVSEKVERLNAEQRV